MLYGRSVTARVTVLTTERLCLTTWLPEDAADLHVVHSDPETMRFVRSGRPETLEETTQLVASYVEAQETRGWTKWRLADHDGRIVGRAGFGALPAHDEPTAQHRELAYTIRRERWAQGLATEIAVALVRWNREHPDPAFDPVLLSHVAVENPASARVLEKVGFVRRGVVDHEGMPCWLYAEPPAS